MKQIHHIREMQANGGLDVLDPPCQPKKKKKKKKMNINFSANQEAVLMLLITVMVIKIAMMEGV